MGPVMTNALTIVVPPVSRARATHDLGITRRPEAVQLVPVDVTSCGVRRTFSPEAFEARQLVSAEFEPFVDTRAPSDGGATELSGAPVDVDAVGGMPQMNKPTTGRRRSVAFM
jgi:hypothetical protein